MQQCIEQQKLSIISIHEDNRFSSTASKSCAPKLMNADASTL